MRREDLPRLRPAATYVLPRWKLVYVSNPKAACTSIKWILADLQGVEPETFYDTLFYESTRATTIHRDRSKWTQTPRLRRMSDEQLAEITPDNGWLVFTATRHPASRLWSGWQSKLLLREPGFFVRFGEEPWFPRLPRTTDDVLEAWFRFIEHVGGDEPGAIMQDVHFRPQARQLNIATTPYDRIYDTSEFGVLLDDLTKHLRGLGWDGELTVRRSNETPLPALKKAFPPHVTQVIERHYERDYRLLKYPTGVPQGVRDDESYPEDLVATIGMLVERHERVGDLTRKLRVLNRQVNSAQLKMAALRQRLAAPKPPPPSVAQRVTQRLPFK